MEKNLSERDREVIWHPYSPQKYAPDAIPIAKGEGVFLIGTDGRKYIDCISSWWVTIHGHGHPYIAEKIYRQALQLEQVIFAGFTHEPAVLLAERLLPILPGKFSKIFYSDNGSTAVEVALKMAVQFWWNQGIISRKKIFAFRNAYHGDTFGAMSVSGRSVFNAAFEAFMFEVIYLDIPAVNNLEDNKKVIDAHAGETACFIYEPLLQGAGGMNMYDPGAMDDLLGYVRDKAIICIADEVLTGFGRTGSLFAGDQLKHKADIICLSKGLTGGTMAMGITACSSAVHEAFQSDDRLKTFFHGHSFTANPITCAAALASLDLLLDDNCRQQIRTINKKHLDFASRLKSAELPEGSILNVRVLGTIIAFELNTHEKNYLNQSGKALSTKAMEHSVFLRPLGNTVYLMPPYCITEDQLETVYKVMISLLQQKTAE
ncbi:MAG TPA: adenosylmethionine--8-amino-7-oxononanoate transaminase [Flavitalea sp.]|nr:adenosylmethionine--8-amino-7-oxononanoate transaminase [Flavitalea sp.]